MSPGNFPKGSLPEIRKIPPAIKKIKPAKIRVLPKLVNIKVGLM